MPGSKSKSPNLIQSFENYLLSAESPEAIESFLDMAQRAPQYAAIRLAVVYHKKPIISVVEQRLPNFPFIVRLLRDNPIVFEIEIPQTARRDAQSGLFAFIPGSRPDIGRLISVSYSTFWLDAIKPFLKKTYPLAMPVFFRQQEIENALLNLEGQLGEKYQVQIADVTSKEERLGKDTKRKYLDTDRRWTNLPIQDAFDQAREREQWFTSVRFQIHSRKRDGDILSQIAVGRLYKYGEMNFDFLYGEIARSLVEVLENAAADRLALLQGRGLKERNYEPSKPIEIAYDFDAFPDVQAIRKFGQVIQAYPNSTKAVFHANPYYHASVADFLDGSSFDVWVLSQRRIVIIPQAQSNAQAFERLISHIFSKFGEGTVNEFQEQ